MSPEATCGWVRVKAYTRLRYPTQSSRVASVTRVTRLIHENLLRRPSFNPCQMVSTHQLSQTRVTRPTDGLLKGSNERPRWIGPIQSILGQDGPEQQDQSLGVCFDEARKRITFEQTEHHRRTGRCQTWHDRLDYTVEKGLRNLEGQADQGRCRCG